MSVDPHGNKMPTKPELELFTTGKYSDATITCGDKTWRVHKAVVCTRSTYFHNALDGPFHEAQTGTVDIKEENPQTLNKVLEFIYTSAYSIDKTEHPVVADARVWVAADKYQLQDLKLHAIDRFNQSLKALDEATLSSDKGATALNELIIEVYTELQGFAQLRDALIQHVQPLLKTLLRNADFIEHAMSVKDFTVDLLRHVVNSGTHDSTTTSVGTTMLGKSGSSASGAPPSHGWGGRTLIGVTEYAENNYADLYERDERESDEYEQDDYERDDDERDEYEQDQYY